MNQETRPADREVLAGLVERVTFHNAENGFCVLRVKARGHRDLVTVVGHAATICNGEWITISGEWVNDRTHGQQFRAHFMRTSTPTSIEGIEKYLSSGMIRGIGPVYAKKMVRAFGEKVFDIIEGAPDRLREVDGIGPVRARRITTAWAEQKIVREIMVFLHSHGVGTARSVRIFKTYGADAIQVMTENPYRLARDIRGIGFKTADAIAGRLGIEKTAMIRVRAGISYALVEAMDEGHCGLPTGELIRLAIELLEVPEELVVPALDLELTEGILMQDLESVAGDLHRLLDLGVTVAIDDFGTGYSSLNYIKRLPINRLKIDQSFVRGLCTDPNDAAIIRAIITLGHSLDLSVLAEGVETEEQLSRLRAEGCDDAQGYFIGRPMPAAEFRKLVHRDGALLKTA